VVTVQCYRERFRRLEGRKSSDLARAQIEQRAVHRTLDTFIPDRSITERIVLVSAPIGDRKKVALIATSNAHCLTRDLDPQ
jgi:hypothetical protein